MKAAICQRYSSVEVVEMQKPTPKENEVLIKIKSSSINAYDWHIWKGDPILVRFREGLRKPKPNTILGCDVAGIVEAIGKNIKDFQVGDAVYGCLADGSGDSAYAEYVCAKEGVLAKKPDTLSFTEASAIPMAAVTALQGLRCFGGIKKGQSVLINGASGGVGTFSVQLAKSFGAVVTGVCSTANLDMVRSLDADEVIDYKKEDFTRKKKKYDVIIDVAASHSLREYRRVLKPDGVCVAIGFSSFWKILNVMLFGKCSAKKARLLMADNGKREDLEYIHTLFAEGKIRAVIDAEYPLERIKEAFDYFEKEHAKGKVIIKM